jgi:hypothetical protein
MKFLSLRTTSQIAWRMSHKSLQMLRLRALSALFAAA